MSTFRNMTCNMTRNKKRFTRAAWPLLALSFAPAHAAINV